MIQQLELLEKYFLKNNMLNTLQIFRSQLLCKIPQKPSQQLLSLLDCTDQNNNKVASTRNKQRSLRKKKQQIPLEGLLGQIAYSTKLLQDSSINMKINSLMENKIFLKAVDTMFPLDPQVEQQQEYCQNKNLQAEGYKELPDQLEFASIQNRQEEQGSFSSANQISMIDFVQDTGSLLSQPSYVMEQLSKTKDDDQYLDDNDLGYEEYIFEEEVLMQKCAVLTHKYAYPQSAVRKPFKSMKKKFRKKTTKQKFSGQTLFPDSQDSKYPLQFNGTLYDCLLIGVIYDRQKTGYQQVKDLKFQQGDLLAGKYEIKNILGSGVFAHVIKVTDINTLSQTCFKMISNNKDFLDQALDEVKILRFIKANCNPDKHHLLNFKGAFYHRQHLFIETDLLKDNLFVAYRKTPTFFSISVIKVIAKQILQALMMLHKIKIIHADLKPENILIKTYSPLDIKVIDMGNSCFVHDNLGAYVQSRSYRAPQVILGTGYNEKIDLWSLGCILAQIWTKNVLFYNVNIQGMLARIQSIIGPWPQNMLDEGKHVSNYFSKENLIFYEEQSKFHILIPKKTTLRNRIRSDDQGFLNFISQLLKIDPEQRLSAEQALNHYFIQAH